MAGSSNIKAEAQRLVNALPEDVTWDDVMYQVYVRQCADAGIEDAENGRVVDVEEVRKKFGLAP